jgi:hypothetical protein
MALTYTIGFVAGFVAGRYGPSVVNWMVYGRPEQP